MKIERDQCIATCQDSHKSALPYGRRLNIVKMANNGMSVDDIAQRTYPGELPLTTSALCHIDGSPTTAAKQLDRFEAYKQHVKKVIEDANL
jgi:hypothetical protein